MAEKFHKKTEQEITEERLSAWAPKTEAGRLVNSEKISGK